MSFEVFCKRVSEIAKRTGSKVRFFKEDERHIARCTDGVTIVGNSGCKSVYVKWGDGHTAHAYI